MPEILLVTFHYNYFCGENESLFELERDNSTEYFLSEFVADVTSQVHRFQADFLHLQ